MLCKSSARESVKHVCLQIWTISSCISCKQVQKWCTLSLDQQGPCLMSINNCGAYACDVQASNKPTIVCHCFNLLIKFWGKKEMYPWCMHSVSNLMGQMNNAMWLVRCSNCLSPLPVRFIFIMSFSFPWNLWHIHQQCDKLDVQWNGVWLRAVED